MVERAGYLKSEGPRVHGPDTVAESPTTATANRYNLDIVLRAGTQDNRADSADSALVLPPFPDLVRYHP